LTTAYKADTFKNKVNLGVGAYRDDDNKPWVLPVVKKVSFFCFPVHYEAVLTGKSTKATSILLNDETLDHEYLPILGLTDFTSAAAKLILGAGSPATNDGRSVSAQTISGTGANHLGALFLSRFYKWNGPPKVYLSNPTWGEWYLFIVLQVIGTETLI
jgi:aspartate aminotransferase